LSFKSNAEQVSVRKAFEPPRREPESCLGLLRRKDMSKEKGKMSDEQPDEAPENDPETFGG
jgi:hypothetical protein